MPRFVIQEHTQAQGVHWDLMLEQGETLATWRLEMPPTADALQRGIACVKIADHRPAYLSYEGPVSGDRGSVRIWDRGQFVAHQDDDGSWAVTFHGDRCRCDVVLQPEAQDGPSWHLCLPPAQ